MCQELFCLGCSSPLCPSCHCCHNTNCGQFQYCTTIFDKKGLPSNEIPTPEEVKKKSITNHLENFMQEINSAGDPSINTTGYAGDKIYTSQQFSTYIKSNTAPKDKTNKPSWWLFPYEEAEEVRKVFEHGATKYHAPFTYRQGTGVPLNDLWDATKRHLLELHFHGHYHKDIESMCLTWAHIAANALMAIAAINLKQGK